MRLSVRPTRTRILVPRRHILLQPSSRWAITKKQESAQSALRELDPTFTIRTAALMREFVPKYSRLSPMLGVKQEYRMASATLSRAST